MASILFVHGTGVRKASYDATFEIVSEKVRGSRPEWTVERCYWGDPYGAV